MFTNLAIDWGPHIVPNNHMLTSLYVSGFDPIWCFNPYIMLNPIYLIPNNMLKSYAQRSPDVPRATREEFGVSGDGSRTSHGHGAVVEWGSYWCPRYEAISFTHHSTYINIHISIYIYYSNMIWFLLNVILTIYIYIYIFTYHIHIVHT